MADFTFPKVFNSSSSSLINCQASQSNVDLLLGPIFVIFVKQDFFFADSCRQIKTNCKTENFSPARTRVNKYFKTNLKFGCSVLIETKTKTVHKFFTWNLFLDFCAFSQKFFENFLFILGWCDEIA